LVRLLLPLSFVQNTVAATGKWKKTLRVVVCPAVSCVTPMGQGQKKPGLLSPVNSNRLESNLPSKSPIDWYELIRVPAELDWISFSLPAIWSAHMQPFFSVRDSYQNRQIWLKPPRLKSRSADPRLRLRHDSWCAVPPSPGLMRSARVMQDECVMLIWFVGGLDPCFITLTTAAVNDCFFEQRRFLFLLLFLALVIYPIRSQLVAGWTAGDSGVFSGGSASRLSKAEQGSIEQGVGGARGSWACRRSPIYIFN
jgi:hypothetical protein